MTANPDPFALAHDLATEFEEILEINDLAGHIDALNGSLVGIAQQGKRDFGLGEAASLAGMFVGLVSLIIQIRRGNTYQGEPEEKITERLILKLSEETSLPAKTRERLINKLINIEFKMSD